jgi:hypothetical protein
MKKVSNLMKLISLTVVLLLVIPEISHAQGGKANFSGSWALNESKSTLPQGGGGGGGQRMGGRNFTIKQDANTLTRITTNQDGEQRETKYTLDGKESVSSTGRGDSKSTAKWSSDGKSLTIVTKSNYNGNERTSTAVWSLTDAKTLSIATTRPGRDGGEPVKSTMVYDKK